MSEMLARRIREHVELQHSSYAELARRLTERSGGKLVFNRDQLHRWAEGKSFPRPRSLAVLADYLDLDDDDLAPPEAAEDEPPPVAASTASRLRTELLPDGLMRVELEMTLPPATVAALFRLLYGQG